MDIEQLLDGEQICLVLTTVVKWQVAFEPMSSNGNASETKANESFDNGVFFNIEAKRTRSIVWKFISKRSEHVYTKEF